jgi:hypothetical protein
MASIHWSSSGNGNWTTAADWSSGTVPGSSDDAFIGISNVSVTSSANVTVNSLGTGTTDFLTIIGPSVFTTLQGTGTSANFGTIFIEDGSALEVNTGTFDNFGTVALEGISNNTNFIIGPSGFVRLAGGGSIEFSPNGHNFIAGNNSSAELINEDNDISGSGTIFGEIFTNDGIIETNNNLGAGVMRIWGSGAGGGSFDNEGSMFVDAGGTMVLGIFTSTIANDGIIQFLGTNSSQAKMEISGDLTIRSVGGQILLQGPDPANDFIVSDGNAATLNLDGGTLSGGGTVGDANLTVNIEQGTVVNANGGTLIFNTSTNTIGNVGTMEATNGGLLEIDGPLNNTNGMIVASGGTVSIDGVVSNGSGMVSIGLDGTLELLGEGSITGNVNFTGTDARLFLDLGGSQISGNVSGAAGGDSFDFQLVQFASGVQAAWQQNGATGTLSLVNNGSTLATLTLAGQYATSDFVAMSDGHNGTLVDVLNPAPAGGTTADMIMRHGADGVYEIYDIGNNAILTAYPLGQVGSNWQVAGLGGFNGADTTDMILRNSNTGGFEVYDISNNNITNAAFLGTVGLNWQVAGFGDFSSTPGQTDMLTRNSNTGAFEVYDISNNQITNAVSMGTVGLNWQVGGFGNFSSLGESDMILRNMTTGGLEVYDISNNQITNAAFIGTVGLNWQIVGTGDFSSMPEETDLMMRNANTGAFEVYDIANNQIMSAFAMGTVGLNWQVAGFGPMSGAGTSDMVLRDANTGAFEVYNIANNQLTTAASLGSVGLDWQVGGFAVDPASGPMGSSDSSNAQLVQAMAGFGGSSGAADGMNPALGADASQQQQFLTSPQHA